MPESGFGLIFPRLFPGQILAKLAVHASHASQNQPDKQNRHGSREKKPNGRVDAPHSFSFREAGGSRQQAKRTRGVAQHTTLSACSLARSHAHLRMKLRT
ncbi:hypothetical protein L1887_46817 [Cichorium endivia]|nr:hypothetical protein L1887_46817 [Cichorium endivia]